jgi:hypothetical protein
VKPESLEIWPERIEDCVVTGTRESWGCMTENQVWSSGEGFLGAMRRAGLLERAARSISALTGSSKKSRSPDGVKEAKYSVMLAVVLKNSARLRVEMHGCMARRRVEQEGEISELCDEEDSAIRSSAVDDVWMKLRMSGGCRREKRYISQGTGWDGSWRVC